MLFHGLGSGHILDPEVVEDDVRNLDHFHGVDAFEDCIEKGDLFDDEVNLVNIHAVTDIIGMFDKEEDARAKEFLGCGGEDERE